MSDINLHSSESLVDGSFVDLNKLPLNTEDCIEDFTQAELAEMDGQSNLDIMAESEVVSDVDRMRAATNAKRLIGVAEYYLWMKIRGRNAIDEEGIPTYRDRLMPASMIICANCGELCCIRPAWEYSTVIVQDMCGQCVWCNGKAQMMIDVYQKK